MDERSHRILIAPDKFKGSLDAGSVASALARGIRDVAPDVETIELPVADGGEGTVDAALAAGFTPVSTVVRGPNGGPVEACYAVHGDTAVIEMAEASGLQLVPRHERSPLTASTFGTGQLIAEALDLGVKEVVLGLGGSATTDGGAGLLIALGARLVTDGGILLTGQGGVELEQLRSIDVAPVEELVSGCRVVVATDVTNPLLGPDGAASVFGPQKGAVASDIDRLDRALAHFADRVAEATGRDMSRAAGAGAAGGVGFAALAVLGAEPVSGAHAVLDLVGFDDIVSDADLVITGEGSLDRQSLSGKAPVIVAERARAFGVPVVAVAGRISLDPDELRAAGFCRSVSLGGLEPDLARSLARAHELVYTVGRHLAADLGTA